MTRRHRAFRIAGMVLFFAPIAIFLIGMLIMFLWNQALVPVLHISTVTFWQGLGILVLTRILFGGFHGRGRSPRRNWRERMKEKWDNMTPEERERMKEKLKNNWWMAKNKPQESSGSTSESQSEA